MFKLTWDISELINIVVKIPYCNKPDNNFKDRKEIYNYLLTIIPSKIEFSPIELEDLEIGGFSTQFTFSSKALSRKLTDVSRNRSHRL